MPAALRTAPLLPGRWAALAPARGAGGAGVWARGALGPDGAPLAAAAAAAVRRGLEAADAPAAMQLCFAPAGGAGGGLASALLQRLRDEHPDVPCLAAAMAPSATSAPAPAAYSAPLCLADVAEHAALTLWIDNDALSSVLDTASAGTGIAAGASRRDRLGSLNALAAAALAGASACHRLRGDCAGGLYPPCDVAALTAALVPYPRLHLLAPALAPAPWLARRCLEAPAGGNEGAPAEAMPQQQQPMPPPRAGFPLEQRIVAELMAPRSLLLRAGGASSGAAVFGGEADEPPPLRGRLLAGALLLRGDALSLPAAAAAAARCAFAAPGSLPPWATAGASPAAPLLCAASPAPAHWRIGGGNAPPGGGGGTALLNGTFAALSLSGVAARFGAAYRRRAGVHLFTQEGLTCADLAAAAETLLDWSDEYSVFDTPHDVALSSTGGDEAADAGEDDGYSDEEWRGAREGLARGDEASELDEPEAEEETPEAVRPAGGMAHTTSPPWLREALRRGRQDTEIDVSTASERGSEARAEELSNHDHAAR